MKSVSRWTLGITAMAISLPGCGGSGSSSEPEKPGASRDFVEHPLDAAGGEKSQKAVPPKVQAALEKAKQADPRSR